MATKAKKEAKPKVQAPSKEAVKESSSPAPKEQARPAVKEEAPLSPEIVQQLVLEGDISKMTQDQRVQYVIRMCQSLGLNYLTKPFQIIKFKDSKGEKEILYATKDCTEQLRKVHGVSVTDITATELKGVYMVVAKCVDKHGRSDVGTGVVPLSKEEKFWNNELRRMVSTGRKIPMVDEELANALMKAETKAKRRATLSICGLGMLDESELETMPAHTTLPVESKVTLPIDKPHHEEPVYTPAPQPVQAQPAAQTPAPNEAALFPDAEVPDEQKPIMIKLNEEKNFTKEYLGALKKLKEGTTTVFKIKQYFRLTEEMEKQFVELENKHQTT